MIVLILTLASIFQLTILADSSLSEQLKVNEWTRAKEKLMIVADSKGLFAQIFVDFGDQFRVDDANGEPCMEVEQLLIVVCTPAWNSFQVFIEHIDKVTGDVMTLENAFHGLEDGDYVTFAEVKGMVELNDIAPIKVTVKSEHFFSSTARSSADLGQRIVF